MSSYKKSYKRKAPASLGKAIYKMEKKEHQRRRGNAVVRAMRGPPAAQYARYPTGATALKAVDAEYNFKINAAGVLTVLPVPEQGAGYFNRLGNRTRGISLQLRGNIVPSAANAAQGPLTCRWVVAYDRQFNATQPPLNSLIQNINQGGGLDTVNPWSFTNIANRDRYKILRDRQIILPHVGATGGNGPLFLAGGAGISSNDGININEFIKLGGLETMYNTVNGGTFADITTGAYLMWVWINDPDSAGSEAWQFVGACRYKWLD